VAGVDHPDLVWPVVAVAAVDGALGGVDGPGLAGTKVRVRDGDRMEVARRRWGHRDLLVGRPVGGRVSGAGGRLGCLAAVGATVRGTTARRHAGTVGCGDDRFVAAAVGASTSAPAGLGAPRSATVSATAGQSRQATVDAEVWPRHRAGGHWPARWRGGGRRTTAADTGIRGAFIVE
jgi:hypothetical protein